MMDLSSLSTTMLASLGEQVFSQNARLIELESAQGPSLPATLVVESFTGREAVNELFCFEVDALSFSTNIDLKQFIGEEMSLRLLQVDGSKRSWHGYCTEASWLGADGGMTRYRFRIEPFLAFLRLRRDCFIFQDKDANQIVTDLLADYPQANFAWEATQAVSSRPICTQYRESDLEFLQRLLMSEGLSWRFEHEQSSPAENAESGGDHNSTPKSRHKFVVFDGGTQLPALPMGATLRYHGIRATDTDDAINVFSALRQVQANAVSISSWHPQQLSAPAAELSSSINNGTLPALAIYDGAGESQYDDAEAASQQNIAMLRAAEMGNKLFTGNGSVRRMAAGYGFTLSQHDNYAPGNDSFKVVSVEHNATNNLDAGMTQLLGGNVLERGTYRNSFTCLRDAVPIVPAGSASRTAPTALGAQIALVVGLDGAPVTSERDHKIKVQFPWQRGQAPHAGGLADTGSTADAKGNAPGNETSGTWVRVAEAMAGPNWGSNFTPRIGTEVLVDFIEGNMDRPVIVAQLFNGSDTPPYSAGTDSGINHAGVISGMHSNNLDGGGYNQWVVDDSPGQLRMRLASSTAASQLNLGYLVSQAPDSAQRGGYRGQGFELHTDAWNVLRGGAGVLISSNARPAQGSSVASTQMDTAESVQRLAAAKDLHDVLAKAADHQQALGSHAATKAQDDMLTQIDPKKDGKHSDTVNGQTAQKAQGGTRTPDAGQPVEKFAQALVHIEGPNNIHLASPATTLTFAGQHLQWNTQSDTHWAAAHTLSSVSGQATSLFTNTGGMQIFAGNGPLSMQAHTDKLEILADKQVTIISVNDQIEINAKEKIVLQAGQSSVTLEGGNITFACPGEFTVKGAQHQFGAGVSKAASLSSLPDEGVNFAKKN